MAKDLLTPKSNYGDWRDFFFEHGYAIFKNAITPERAEYYKSKQIDWLKSFNRGFDPENEDTWTSEHLPVSFKGGMYGSYCAPHERFAWEARMCVVCLSPTFSRAG
ncbi:hypothetical protein Ct61P_00275 [Colletotrichum tofieldiae]|nr:hypothetical protein Ct61P_00275 [Colletotrichum tofieldiae]